MNPELQPLTEDELSEVVGAADVRRLLGMCGCGGNSHCYAHSTITV